VPPILYLQSKDSCLGLNTCPALKDIGEPASPIVSVAGSGSRFGRVMVMIMQLCRAEQISPSGLRHLRAPRIHPAHFASLIVLCKLARGSTQVGLVDSRSLVTSASLALLTSPTWAWRRWIGEGRRYPEPVPLCAGTGVKAKCHNFSPSRSHSHNPATVSSPSLVSHCISISHSAYFGMLVRHSEAT
jgi:hypothetical protein